MVKFRSVPLGQLYPVNHSPPIRVFNHTATYPIIHFCAHANINFIHGGILCLTQPLIFPGDAPCGINYPADCWYFSATPRVP